MCQHVSTLPLIVGPLMTGNAKHRSLSLPHLSFPPYPLSLGTGFTSLPSPVFHDTGFTCYPLGHGRERKDKSSAMELDIQCSSFSPLSLSLVFHGRWSGVVSSLTTSVVMKTWAWCSLQPWHSYLLGSMWHREAGVWSRKEELVVVMQRSEFEEGGRSRKEGLVKEVSLGEGCGPGRKGNAKKCVIWSTSEQ